MITHVICLNISVFDVQWGEIMIRDSSLFFTVTPKPESIQGCCISLSLYIEETVIPEMKSVFPMSQIQVYSLKHINMLFKRTYNCQQSALEFYYHNHGFYNSVLLYFPDPVSFSFLYHP